MFFFTFSSTRTFPFHPNHFSLFFNLILSTILVKYFVLSSIIFLGNAFILAAKVPGLGPNLEILTTSGLISFMSLTVFSKSIFLSPGNPTITEVLITEAEDIVHGETDEPEFDIKIVQNLSHKQIQAIDEVLDDFSNVEMKFVRAWLIISEVEKEDC